ncbi:hypothetical protein FA95DRAFT_1045820 [Auriscalpium vulgare]|uniref:Uncharacterized protein n=1 Tax=Auriscalpium vulgare TaxID=40419 RepID=A0ACB8S9E9_9AGAM|nr:hypothetical protein FA95DRAFT_1045820 [Auriscalpium vulgare]
MLGRRNCASPAHPTPLHQPRISKVRCSLQAGPILCARHDRHGRHGLRGAEEGAARVGHAVLGRARSRAEHVQGARGSGFDARVRGTWTSCAGARTWRASRGQRRATLRRRREGERATPSTKSGAGTRVNVVIHSMRCPLSTPRCRFALSLLYILVHLSSSRRPCIYSYLTHCHDLSRIWQRK